MATTWQGRSADTLPASFRASVADDWRYEIRRVGGGLTYSVEFNEGRKLSLNVQIAMGGSRHGLGFLIPVEQVDGIPLARRALIQARYAWSPEKKKLLVAPGCESEKPASIESALGLVLSPTFESRCLNCHGQPNVSGSGAVGGVHCQSCHGPGSEHLTAVGRGEPRHGIVNPKRLSTEDSIGVCAGCHVGLARFADPSPDDLLVANQVNAMKSSECFRQSREGFSCTTCHDPHGDAEAANSRAVQACQGCHGGGGRIRAAICPVNSQSGCIACHMPSVEMGPLHLVDHLIRVHPEQRIPAHIGDSGSKTHVTPKEEALRMISTNTAEAAAAARNRITKGEAFYQVAREISVDGTAAIGGYLGRKALIELPAGLRDAAARLAYAETSEVIQDGAKWVILQRLPRDFQWTAEQLQIQAEALAATGDAVNAIGKAQEALMIYPRFLRALSFIGMTFAQAGNPKRGAQVLATAQKLYPEDAGINFLLGSVLGLAGDKAAEGDAYRRAIALDGDFTAAYANLGKLSYASGDWSAAAATFRRGLQIDPLSAELYYDLSLALGRSGDQGGATQAMALAVKLDPRLQIQAAGR